jgi:aquaporin Z
MVVPPTSANRCEISGPAIPRRVNSPGPLSSLRAHWPEYLMESGELGLFMVSACLFTTVLEYPASPARQLLPTPFVRHALIGIAMAVTLIALIHSGWGKRSGAHMNPAMTLMFFRLGKVETWDAIFYVVGQFVGGFTGVTFAFLLIGRPLAHPSVSFAVTRPGMWGTGVALMAELVISFVLAIAILVTSNHQKLSRFTPYVAACLVATYITFEAPLSGMSMNPARTLGSALSAHTFQAVWIYFVAPPIAMLVASEVYLHLLSASVVYCAKLNHHNHARCIFRCRFEELLGT